MKGSPQKEKKISPVRKDYTLRLIFRILIFIACLTVLLVKPSAFEILHGMNFFKEFSVFHLLWAVWVFSR